MTEICYDYQKTNRLSLFDTIRQAIARRLENHKARASIRDLQQLDDRILTDIGLDRDDLYWAENLPATENPIKELKCCRQTRLDRKAAIRKISRCA